MTTWHKGPPPSIGWWPASYSRHSDVFRWWGGEYWSFACYRTMTAREAARQAAQLASDIFEVEWTDRPDDWPERSRT